MKKSAKLITVFISLVAFASIVIAVLFGLNAAGIVRIFKTPITLRIEADSKEYDGKPFEITNYSVTRGSLVPGDYIEFEGTSMINAGEYDSTNIEYHIYNRNNADVTNQYSVTEDFRTIEIEKRKITIRTGSDFFSVDDAKENGAKYEWAEIISGSLVLGHYIEYDNFPSYKEEGIFDNTCDVSIYYLDENNQRIYVTENYEILFNYGSLFVFNGEMNENDEQIESKQGENVYGSNLIFSNPDVYDDAPEIDEERILEEQSRILYLVSPDSPHDVMLYGSSRGDYNLSKTNGVSHFYKPKYGVNPLEFVSSLLEGKAEKNSLTVKYFPEFTRDYDMVYEYPILNKLQDNDVYCLVSTPTLKGDHVKIEGYDYDFISNPEYVLESEFKDPNYVKEEAEYSDFVYSNYLDLPKSTSQAVREVIEVYNLEGEDLVDTAKRLQRFFYENFTYSIVQQPCQATDDAIVDFLTNNRIGRCEHFSLAGMVLLREMGYPARIYGCQGVSMPVANIDYEVNGGSGHSKCQAYLDGKGWVSLEFTKTALKESGEDDLIKPPQINDDYSEADLILTTEPQTKVYDGKPLVDNDKVYVTGSLKEGHKIFYSLNTYLIDAGSIQNRPYYIIYDSNFNDVTDEYNIYEQFGQFVITGAPLTVSTTSESKNYDGEPLYGDFETNGLVNGDYVMSWYGSNLTEKGTILNSIVLREIVNDSRPGVNLISNYIITYLYGSLTVK